MYTDQCPVSSTSTLFQSTTEAGSGLEADMFHNATHFSTNSPFADEEDVLGTTIMTTLASAAPP